MIQLAVGRLEVDWGKNNSLNDHGTLFQTTDLKLIPTYHEGEDWPEGEPIVEMKQGFGKPLGHVLARLELLGHTLRSIEHHYNRLHQFHNLKEDALPFEDLRQALARVDVNTVSGIYGDDYDPGEFVRKEIFQRLALRSETYNYRQPRLQPDSWEIGLLLENLGAESVLRLLAENPANLNLDVSWDFTSLLESGWPKRDEFQAGPSPEQCFLVVTEGSSDAKIIKQALQLFRPHIADLFRFVDMEEGYPFSGTGNLHKFTQGLISIGVRNNAVVVYDNDAEGIAKMQATKRLSLPPNMRVMQLPNLDEFSNFRTIGPTGIGHADINGRAAAIECYLDLEIDGLPEPIIRWTAFNKELGVYHGELEHKSQYMKDFLRLRLPSPSYKSIRIESVLDALVGECVSIAEQKHMSVGM
jgi:hypothetical protein